MVAETGAIVDYLTARCDGALVPAPGTVAHRRYSYWLHYAEGSAMPPLLLKLVFSRLAPGSPALVRPLVKGIAKAVTAKFVDPELRRHAAYWEGELADRPWFCGDAFSAADIHDEFSARSLRRTRHGRRAAS